MYFGSLGVGDWEGVKVFVQGVGVLEDDVKMKDDTFGYFKFQVGW